jgi:hypothetical protein
LGDTYTCHCFNHSSQHKISTLVDDTIYANFKNLSPIPDISHQLFIVFTVIYSICAILNMCNYVSLILIFV